MPKIIDCFIFYNELNLLNLRFHELNPDVDLFVLVESTKTFSNNPKPLFYLNNKELFSEFNHKIIHYIVDDMDNINAKNAWDRESHQRNCIRRALENQQITDEDIILYSDLDEIPNPKCFYEINKCLNEDNITRVVLCQRFFYYNFSCGNKEKYRHHKSRNTIALLYKNLKKTSPQYMRGRRGQYHRIHNGGWHCSYFGNSEEIANKIKQFSHQEYNTPKYLDLNKISENIHLGNDLFDRKNEKWEYNDIGKDKHLPKYKELLIDKLLVNTLPF